MENVVLCGFGHATHALVPLMASAGFGVHVLSRRAVRQAEVEISTNQGLRGKAEIGTDPACVRGADYVVLPIPSDAFATYLSMIGPHLKSGQTLVVTPGQGRFKEAVERATDAAVDIAYVLPMPVNCRVVEQGRSVDVKAYKKNFIFTGCGSERAADLQRLFSAKQMLYREGGSVLADLMPINPVIHPARLYSLFRDSDTLDANPLFYEEMAEEDIHWMDAIQRELQQISEAHGVRVPDMFQFLSDFTYETNYPDALAFFTQHTAYTGFRSPVVQREDGKWVLDKSSRYLTEDIDFGLSVWQEYAAQAGIEVPVIRQIKDRLLAVAGVGT